MGLLPAQVYKWRRLADLGVDGRAGSLGVAIVCGGGDRQGGTVTAGAAP